MGAIQRNWTKITSDNSELPIHEPPVTQIESRDINWKDLAYKIVAGIGILIFPWKLFY